MIVISTPLSISSSVRDIERLLRESPPFRVGRMSILQFLLQRRLVLDILETGLGKSLAHAVHIETQLPGGEPPARPRLLRFARGGGGGDFGRMLLGHDDHAVVVRDHHIARMYQSSGANDTSVD